MDCFSEGRRGKSLFEAILARRSVRAYAPQSLPRTTIETLLEAAVHAPTAMLQEPWAFVVVQDTRLLKQISDAVLAGVLDDAHRPDAYGSNYPIGSVTKPDMDVFHGAGTLIVICAKPSAPFVTADCWLAAENLMLAACEMGLGSCVIGSSVVTLNGYRVKTELLDVPSEYSVIAPIIVGVPSGEIPAAVPRKPPLVLAWKARAS
ncbi:coenzyme F420:L-glutamate ligase [Sideroxyarcus emersonii]|uniref:Coenzyme F420:L-glutamate ligase n=2 Tax=Sideroxyarcus emersonii TaxID=2764705 RepID=A0AAN1X9Z8_9PROT|nr:coenzyme F420:L-glutamate ligase [Sideroxyarcus emersonii]